jgi:hypothetical protein
LPFTFSGCFRRQSTEASRQPPLSCRLAPPPEPINLRLMLADAGCPRPFEMCLTRGETLSLLAHVRELRQYAGEAWDRCGMRPDGGAP